MSSRAQSHAMQREAIERAAAGRGDQIGRWFADVETGGTMYRQGLAFLRQAARAGELQRVYVFRLDRLTRSGIRDTFEVVEELRAAGVELVTLADGFTLDGPAAEVILAVLAWAAKMERLAINERIAAARDRVEAEGRGWGRPRRSFDRAEVRKRAKNGWTVRELAEWFNLPASTIRDEIARSSSTENMGGKTRLKTTPAADSLQGQAIARKVYLPPAKR